MNLRRYCAKRPVALASARAVPAPRTALRWGLINGG